MTEVPAHGQDIQTGEGASQHATASDGPSGAPLAVPSASSSGVPGSGPSPSRTAPSTVAPGATSAITPGPRNTAAPGTPSASAGTFAAGSDPADREDRQRLRQAEGAAPALDRTAEGRRGVKLRDVIEDAQWRSAQASTNARFLAAAGFAIVWALAGTKVEGLRSWTLTPAVILLALSLGADFVHYTLSANRLSARIDEATHSGATQETRIGLSPDETAPAHAWFKYKRWLLYAAYAVLALAFVGHVYPNVPDDLRAALQTIIESVAKGIPSPEAKRDMDKAIGPVLGAIVGALAMHAFTWWRGRSDRAYAKWLGVTLRMLHDMHRKGIANTLEVAGKDITYASRAAAEGHLVMHIPGWVMLPSSFDPNA